MHLACNSLALAHLYPQSVWTEAINPVCNSVEGFKYSVFAQIMGMVGKNILVHCLYNVGKCIQVKFYIISYNNSKL